MEHEELYEKLRAIITDGSILPLPKHQATYKLLTNLFDEEEAEIIVSGLKKVRSPVNLGEISNSVGIPKTKLKDKLDIMFTNGLILKVPPEDYMAPPYFPGIFELHWHKQKAQKIDTENMTKVSEAHYELMELSWTQELGDRAYSNWRVIPASKPIGKTIRINESVEGEKTVLPFEILKEHLIKVEPQVFFVIPCACRESAKLAKNPCKRTDENFCVVCGNLGSFWNSLGIGREVTLDELIEIFKNAAKAGLAHFTANIQGSTDIICNCCSCCCVYLRSFKETGGAIGAVARSNFIPERDIDLCTLCEECMQKCPTGAIYHHYPHKKDGTDEYMMIRSELCLGCGICASNCPSDAITLSKVSDIEPAKDYEEMMEKVSEGITH